MRAAHERKDDEQQVTRYARYQIYPAEHARRKLDQKSAAVAVERKKREMQNGMKYTKQAYIQKFQLPFQP